MAEGLGRERWAHTSTLLAMIANAHRDPKKTRPFKPSDFDPYADSSHRGDAVEIDKGNVQLLREAFTRRRQG